MARWRLLAPHYLNLLGEHAAEWEYSEIDRTTGRPKKHKFKVPMHLAPDDPLAWNYREPENPQLGFIVVAHEGKGEPRDYEFTGDPTPDMLPLDPEAEAISASFAKRWNQPKIDLERNYGDVILEGFQKQLAEAQAVVAAPAVQGMDKLMEAMAGMMAQNQQILQQLLKPTETRR